LSQDIRTGALDVIVLDRNGDGALPDAVQGRLGSGKIASFAKRYQEPDRRLYRGLEPLRSFAEGRATLHSGRRSDARADTSAAESQLRGI
jgi:hypothetical protein